MPRNLDPRRLSFLYLLCVPYLLTRFIFSEVAYLSIALLRSLPSLFLYYEYKNTTGIYFTTYSEARKILADKTISEDCVGKESVISSEIFADETRVCMTFDSNVYRIYTVNEALNLVHRKLKNPFTRKDLSFVRSVPKNDGSEYHLSSLDERVSRIGVGAKMAFAVGVATLFYAFYDYMQAERLSDGTRLPKTITFDELKNICSEMQLSNLRGLCDELMKKIAVDVSSKNHFNSQVISVMSEFIKKIGKFHFNEENVRINRDFCITKLIPLDPVNCLVDSSFLNSLNLMDILDEFAIKISQQIAQSIEDKVVFSPQQVATLFDKSYQSEAFNFIKREAMYAFFGCCNKSPVISLERKLQALGEYIGHPVTSEYLAYMALTFLK